MKIKATQMNDFSDFDFISTKQVKFQRGSNSTSASADASKSKSKDKKRDYSQERKQKRGE